MAELFITCITYIFFVESKVYFNFFFYTNLIFVNFEKLLIQYILY